MAKLVLRPEQTLTPASASIVQARHRDIIGLSRASYNPYLLDAVMCSEGDSDGPLGEDGIMLQYAVDTR